MAHLFTIAAILGVFSPLAYNLDRSQQLHAFIVVLMIASGVKMRCGSQSNYNSCLLFAIGCMESARSIQLCNK